MKFKNLIIIICFSFISIKAISQVNFFTKSEQDSLLQNFYTLDYKVSCIGLYGIKHQSFGLALLLHNNNNEFSYYAEFSSNFKQERIINGTLKESDGSTQILVPYSLFACNFGLAKAIKKQLFIYGFTGFVYEYSSFSNSTDSDFYFQKLPFGGYAQIGVGAAYLFNNNIIIAGSIQSYQRNLSLGLGYTF